MIDAISKVYQFDADGNSLGEIQLPGVGSSGGFSSKKEEKELYYRFTNYHSPGVIYKFNAESRESELYWEPTIDFKSSDFESKQGVLHFKGWNSSAYDYYAQKKDLIMMVITPLYFTDTAALM